MLTVYTPHVNTRTEYVIRHIFNNILGTDVVLTTDPDQYMHSPGGYVNYSNTNMGKGIWIYPHPLLTESGWSVHEINMGTWDDLPCFFLQSQGDIPFDIFAASFYLLSRYEEYGRPEKDLYGRFPAESSLACQENFLEIPVVDRWAHQLKKTLSGKKYHLDFLPRSFRFISTFDIDHPFKYRNKSLLYNLAGGVKDLLRGNFSLFTDRMLVQLHLRPDPYMKALQHIKTLHHQYEKDYFFFVHVGPYGKHDRYTIYPRRRFYRFLHSLYDVRFGLHPSFRASFNSKFIKKEKEKLEKILRCDIKRNRQHFLRMQVPDTFQILNNLDFSEDFTLAYASHPGFRAGTCIPFYFYDIQSDEATSLLIRPTILMDATLISYLHMSPEDALQKIKHLADACVLSGGDFTMLWHNSNLEGIDRNPWYHIFVESFLYGISLEKELSLTKF